MHDEMREKRHTIFYGWLIAFISLAVTTTAFGVLYSFGIFFKGWLGQWNCSRAFLSGVFSVGFLVYGISSFFMGNLTDRYGPRKTLALGGFIMGSGAFLTSAVSASLGLIPHFQHHDRHRGGNFLCPHGEHGFPVVPGKERGSRGHRRDRTGIGDARFLTAGAGPHRPLELADRFYHFRRDHLDRFLYGCSSCSGETRGHGPRAVHARVEGTPIKEESGGITCRRPCCGARRRGPHGGSPPPVYLLEALLCPCALGIAFTTPMVHLFPYATDAGIPPEQAALMLAGIGGSSVIGRLALGTWGRRWGPRIPCSSCSPARCAPCSGSS